MKDRVLEALFIGSCVLGLATGYFGFNEIVPAKLSIALSGIAIAGFTVSILVGRGRRKGRLRAFRQDHTITSPARAPGSYGAVVTGHLHLDDSSLRFSIDYAGALSRAHIDLDRLDSYSAQVNAAGRRAEPIVRGVPRRDIVLHVTGPDVAMTVAYGSAYDQTVRYALDAAGLRDLSPHQDGPGATK